MAAYPVHIDGTPAQLNTETIATFPVGTFLENVAVRENGTLLVSSMLAGEIFFVDPNADDPQSTVQKIHTFVSENPLESTDAEEEAGGYGNGMQGEAIVEDLRTKDIFYTFSGTHGQAKTWAVFRLDLRKFDNEGTVKVDRMAEIPWALWLNGATWLPEASTLIMAESLQGQLISCDVDTGHVEVWLEHPLLGKMTDRLPWPGVNGVQYHDGHVFATSSDRAILLRCQVHRSTGAYVEESMTLLAEGVAGDDLAFDIEGNAFVATNPCQTVLKFPGAGLKDAGIASERLIIAGSLETAETAGPTAVAFGRTAKDDKSLYVVTTGGLINPVGEFPGLARVLRVDIGVKGAA